jgi:hypothetical protein
MTTSRAAALALMFTLGGAGAARAADDLPPAIEGTGPRLPRGTGAWQVSAGVRASLVRGAGFDPFSTNDVLSQISLTATRAFSTGPRLASVVGLLFEDGDAASVARGDSTRLTLVRVGLLLEERFAPRPWGYAFVRVAPAWLKGSAALGESASPAPLETSFSTFGVDASAGIAGRLNPRSHVVGLWLVADAGYGWVPAQHMSFSPALPAADRDKAGVTTFDDLKPSGVLFRSSFAVTY